MLRRFSDRRQDCRQVHNAIQYFETLFNVKKVSHFVAIIITYKFQNLQCYCNYFQQRFPKAIFRPITQPRTRDIWSGGGSIGGSKT